ncbi:hypothetical protein OF83DRAFT_1085553, partial [Amylostereum chailletii]
HGYIVLRAAARHVVERVLWKGSVEEARMEGTARGVKEGYLRGVEADAAGGGVGQGKEEKGEGGGKAADDDHDEDRLGSVLGSRIRITIPRIHGRGYFVWDWEGAVVGVLLKVDARLSVPCPEAIVISRKEARRTDKKHGVDASHVRPICQTLLRVQVVQTDSRGRKETRRTQRFGTRLPRGWRFALVRARRSEEAVAVTRGSDEDAVGTRVSISPSRCGGARRRVLRRIFKYVEETVRRAAAAGEQVLGAQRLQLPLRRVHNRSTFDGHRKQDDENPYLAGVEGTWTTSMGEVVRAGLRSPRVLVTPNDSQRPAPALEPRSTPTVHLTVAIEYSHLSTIRRFLRRPEG